MEGQKCGNCGRWTRPRKDSPRACALTTIMSSAFDGERCQAWRLPGVDAKTVRARVGIRVESTGSWHARGSHGWSDAEVLEELTDYDGHPPESVLIHWIEADLPLPASVTVEGDVSS